MSDGAIRVGLIGAGYIAPWHANAIQSISGARVTAVCDASIAVARTLADRLGAEAFSSLEAMLKDGQCDAVHVVSPPHLHRDHAVAALRGGAHVFLEKPFGLSLKDCEAVAAAAATTGKVVAVNHNFLGLGSYVRLRQMIQDGKLGRLDSIDLVWRYPLPLLRSGPFGSWMMREARNLLLELGPHLYAFAVDLCGRLDSIQVRVEKPIRIPGGIEHFQVWRISAVAGGVSVNIHMSLVEGMDDRSVSVRGVCGSAKLDFANDTLVVRSPNTADIILNPLRSEWSVAWQHLGEGARNAWRQIRSLNRKSPYALSFQGAVREFYSAIREGRALDRRFSASSACAVMSAIEDSLGKLGSRPTSTPIPSVVPQNAGGFSVLVTGGTGFIGRYLVRALVDSGMRVRVLSRGAFNPFPELGENVEICAASPRNPAAMAAALHGVKIVYHLARAEASTWEGYLENDVGVAEAVAVAALEAKVSRFIYCGTIASYDASKPGRAITEETTFGDMTRRNLYARSKAMCEERLLQLSRGRGLPLVIARPGIVVGAGGPLQHWGIGRWHGAGAVKLWGSGNNILPFVLVEDVADALVRIGMAPDVIGKSFNLVGDPMLTARDYFRAIHDRNQTGIRVSAGNLTMLYLLDMLKFAVKRTLLGRASIVMPTLRDWRSRAHLSPFRNEHSKSTLGWVPEPDRAKFLQKAVGGSHLFGF
jgi:predicted dehydrogenase/nucleoside-diphosphate-sugar epimerase